MKLKWVGNLNAMEASIYRIVACRGWNPLNVIWKLGCIFKHQVWWPVHLMTLPTQHTQHHYNQ